MHKKDKSTFNKLFLKEYNLLNKKYYVRSIIDYLIYNFTLHNSKHLDTVKKIFIPESLYKNIFNSNKFMLSQIYIYTDKITNVKSYFIYENYIPLFIDLFKIDKNLINNKKLLKTENLII